MIIYGIFVPFIFHLKRICYSFFCLRQYCDLLGYLFYQEILSSCLLYTSDAADEL